MPLHSALFIPIIWLGIEDSGKGEEEKVACCWQTGTRWMGWARREKDGEEKRRPFNTAFATQLNFRHYFCSSFLMISLQKCKLKTAERLDLEEPYKKSAERRKISQLTKTVAQQAWSDDTKRKLLDPVKKEKSALNLCFLFMSSARQNTSASSLWQ